MKAGGGEDTAGQPLTGRAQVAAGRLESLLRSDWSNNKLQDRSEEVSCSLIYVKTQLKAPKVGGFGTKCHNWEAIPGLALCLYGIRAPIIGPSRAWKPTIPYAIKNQRGARNAFMVLYGIRELA